MPDRDFRFGAGEELGRILDRYRRGAVHEDIMDDLKRLFPGSEKGAKIVFEGIRRNRFYDHFPDRNPGLFFFLCLSEKNLSVAGGGYDGSLVSVIREATRSAEMIKVIFFLTNARLSSPIAIFHLKHV